MSSPTQVDLMKAQDIIQTTTSISSQVIIFTFLVAAFFPLSSLFLYQKYKLFPCYSSLEYILQVSGDPFPIIRTFFNLSTYKPTHFSKGLFQNEVNSIAPTNSASLNVKYIPGKPEPDPPFLQITSQDFLRGPKIRYWWLGHASCLFQLGETYIITDPIGFSQSFYPNLMNFSFPYNISDFPTISYCIISHSDEDHFDPPSIMILHEYFPKMIVIGGLNISSLISSFGFPKHLAYDFDWRQSAFLPPLSQSTHKSDMIKLTCMPAQHSMNKYLWVSYLLEYQNIFIYFPGDTTIGPQFEEVANLVGHPIDLVTIPAGPWGMRTIHLDPVDAKKMFDVLKAKKATPIHIRTFKIYRLVFKKDNAPERLDDEAIYDEFKKAGQENSLINLKLGGSLEYNFETKEFEASPNSSYSISFI